MKKVILLIIILLISVLTALTITVVKIRENDIASNKNTDFNSFFEKYKDKTLYGTEVLTIINKAIDINEKNKYIANIQETEKPENVSVEIIFIYTDKDGNILEKKSKMEDVEKAGLSNFIANFSLTEFKCEKIEYNTQDRVKNVILKQIEI